MQSTFARRSSSSVDRDLLTAANRLLAHAGKARPRPSARPSLFVAEPLEPRQLLAADLAVTLNFPAVTVLPTEEISGTLTLRNFGDIAADNFVTRIVLSQDNIFGNGDDIAVEDIPESGNGGLVGGEIFVVSGTLTIPQIVAPGTYFLLAKIDVNNEVGEDNENNNVYTSVGGLITIADRPQVTVTAVDATASENSGDTGRFAIRRNGPTGLPLTVTYNITGSATEGLDYLPTAGTVTFLPGESVAYVTIFPDDDSDTEGNETVVLSITSGEDYDAGFGGTGTATVTIVDNEPVPLPAPDLAAGVAGAVGQFLPGETINATFGRSNFGSTGATNFTTRFVLSVNNIYGDDDDIFVADVLNSTLLAAGGITSNVQGLTVPLNAVPLQSYYLLGNIDVFNTVPEFDESNNAFGTTTASVTIAAPPTISIAATDNSASETPGNPGRFTFTRTGPASLALTVNLTISGTATSGSDYTAIATTVTFAAGSSTATIDVLPIDDTEPESTETVIITLAAGPLYTVSSTDNSATVSIVDNEPLISVVATTASTSESGGSGPGQFTFSRAGSTDSSITVNFLVTGTATGGTDYTTIATSVTFGIGETTVVIDVTAIDDNLFEPGETVIVTLQTGATYTIASGAGDASITILDDEPVFAVTASTSSTSETSGSAAGVFTFTRTGPTTSAFSLPYTITGTATGGTDYTALSGMITFAIGESSVTLNVSALDDALVEDTETVIVSIAATANYGVDDAAASATVSIADDEPTISVVASIAQTSETPGGTSARFTFTRTGPLGSAFVATYTIGGTATAGADYAALSGTITFVSGSATAFIDIPAINDSIAENTETIIVSLAADTSFRIDGAAGTATVSILDDEPTISIVATDALGAETGGNTGLFTLTRTGPLTGTFSLTILITGTATGGSDYQTISTTVTFLAGASTATLDVTPIDDLDVEGDETVIVSLVADPSFRADSAASMATVVINDNESLVSISALDSNAAETAGDTARFVFSRIGALQNDLTVTFSIGGTATNGVDYTQLFGNIVIPANQASITLTLAALQDAIRESTETIILTITGSPDYSISNVNGAATVRLVDDESNPAPASDLTASLVLSASNVRPTQDITVTLTVRNRGTTPGSDFDNQIVLSTNNIFGDADDILLDSVRIVGSSMPNGSSRVVTFMVAVPDLAPGNYFVLAKTDVAGEVTETSESNNVFRPAGSGNLVIAPPPTISVAATDAAAAEVATGAAANGGRFTFTRTGPTGVPLTINYTVAGTATSGVDFTAFSGTITFAIGSATATVDVTVLPDLIAESTETVIFGVGRGVGYTIDLSRQQATVNIADNEPVVTITAADRTAAESSGTANPGRYTVRRTGSTALPLVVNYTVSGTATSGADFTALSGTVTILAGQTSADIVLSVVQDTIVEDPETVIVTLASSTAYTIGTAANATVTIADDEPTVSIMASDAAASETGDNIGRFTVTRTGSRADSLVVQYSLSGTSTNGADYDLLSGFVTIPAGESSATIIVTPIDDTTGETPETVIVTLAGNTAYTINDPQAAGTVTIADNEAVVTITAATSPATEAGLRTTRYTVTRTGSRTLPLTVTYSVEGSAVAGTDYVALTGTVIIPAGQSSAPIVLTPLNDNFGEATETVIVSIQPGTGYRGGDTNDSATANITDDEPVATVVANDASATETGPRTGSFLISLSRAATQNTTISYTLGGTATASGLNADFAPLTGFVTIAAGQRTATVFITPVQDNIGEGDETVTLTLVGNTGYLASSAEPPEVTITDDEPFVSVSATDPNAGEGGQNPGRYTFTRTGPTTDSLTVTYILLGTATSDDYAPLSGSITFAAGTSSAILQLNPITDLLAEEDETVILTVTGSTGYRIADAGGIATVTIAALGPIVSLVGTDLVAAEGTTNTARFTVSRTGPTTDPLNVFITRDGTATFGTDYSGVSPMITIPAGRSSTVITLSALEDLIGEVDETVIVTLDTDDAYRINSVQTTATATITDNEPVVKIVATDAIATEGSTSDTARFTVSRTGSTAAAIIVNYSISGSATNGTDYTTLSGTITIPAGRSSTVLTVSALADLVVEGDESLTLDLVAGTGYRLSALPTDLTAAATLRNAGTPDLAFDALTLTPATISLTQPGQITPVTANFKNLGAAAASAFRVELRLSANNILGDADDIVLGFVDLATLAALANGTATFNINWDATVSPALGSYYLGARIDSRNQVRESSESNNSFVTATPVITIVP